MAELDVYRSWLGIQDAERPLTHYQLLRLPRFEDDAGKIRSNYRKMNAHVRKYASGDFAKQSQDLLNELARAMLCLTDAGRKQDYDQSLGRETATSTRRRSLEQILLGRGQVTPEQMQKARSYADAIGLELRDALVQQKVTDAGVVTPAYAESLGLPFVELADVGVDASLAPLVPPVLARQHSCVPVMVDDGQVLMASPNPLMPDVEEELRLRFQKPVRTVICTPADIHAAIQQHFSRQAEAASTTTTPKAAAPKTTSFLDRLMGRKKQ